MVFVEEHCHNPKSQKITFTTTRINVGFLIFICSFLMFKVGKMSLDSNGYDKVPRMLHTKVDESRDLWINLDAIVSISQKDKGGHLKTCIKLVNGEEVSVSAMESFHLDGEGQIVTLRTDADF